MKKLKTMLIACLCAVTTFVTFGAVKSAATVRADDATTDYIYRDTTVASVSVNDALTTYPRLELMGTDFNDSNGTYNKGKDYTTVNSLNTFTKIKVDGTAVGSVWDGNITDPYLNMYDNSVDRFAFKFTDFPTATEIVIEEGCEFPSYALWSGTGDKIVYKTTETATFKKVDGVWVKQIVYAYEDTCVVGVSINTDSESLAVYPRIELTDTDYTDSNGTFNNKINGVPNYMNVKDLNTFSKIKIDGVVVGSDYAAADPYLNMFETTGNRFAFKFADFPNATEIIIEEGCEFPSYALWSGTGSIVYKTTKTATFKKINGAWYKVYTATFVDETGNELGKATFTTADTALTYPTYEADPAYDYAWKNNEIKAEDITVTLTKAIKTFDVIIGEAAAVKYNYGSKITAPAEEPSKTKDGYTVTFDGWYNGDTKWNFETDTVTSNVTLVAKFNETINTYNAKLILCDGTEKDIVYTIENRTEKLAETREFLGTTNAQYTYTNDLPTELPLENGKTYTETRTLNEYDVKIGETAATKVAYGSKLTRPADPTKDTTVDKVYTFDGWYNGDTKWNFDTDTVKGNVTLVPKFNETARKYTVTVTFDGLEKDTVTLQVEYNGTVDFSAYAEDGYNMTIKNGETEIDGLTVTGDVNITVTYAKKPAADKKGCGGSVNGVMPVLAILCLAGAVAVIKKKRV